MAPEMLAGEVIKVLSPFLVEGGMKLAGKLGENVPDYVGKLWTSVRDKLRKKPGGEEIINNYIQNPQDNLAQNTFQYHLVKLMKQDLDFQVNINQLLQLQSSRTTTRTSHKTETKISGDNYGPIGEKQQVTQHFTINQALPQPSYRKLLYEGIHLLKSFSYKAAELKLTEAIKAESAEPEAHYYLALALLAGESFKAANIPRKQIEHHLIFIFQQKPDWLPPQVLLAILEIDYYNETMGISSGNGISINAVAKRVRNKGLSVDDINLIGPIKVGKVAKQRLGLNS